MPQVIANVCFLGLIAGFSALSVLNPDAFYVHVQEDQPLEWSTVWAFIVASAFFARAAFSQRRERPLPWFSAGLACLCVLFALEEISWGQRLFGYRPPRYFLENNYQLELNLHNILPTSVRQQILGAIFIGYGLLLPLLERIPSTNKALRTLGITAPPLGLAPIFGALLGLLVLYPLPYTGELVEARHGARFSVRFHRELEEARRRLPQDEHLAYLRWSPQCRRHAGIRWGALVTGSARRRPGGRGGRPRRDRKTRT